MYGVMMQLSYVDWSDMIGYEKKLAISLSHSSNDSEHCFRNERRLEAGY